MEHAQCTTVYSLLSRRAATHLAELGDRLLDDVLAKLGVHDVAGHGNGAAAALGNLLCRVVALLHVEVADDDVRAVRGEEERGSLADALSRAGDDGHLALEQGAGEALAEVRGELLQTRVGGHGWRGVCSAEVDVEQEEAASRG